ncbi:TPA: type III secretion system protein [Klebsiella aerogenes]|nr:type III secretion system protein [Klebsiella aerogenes]HDU5192809.1 type III secretion system protein [Klebsiella aerogenes]
MSGAIGHSTEGTSQLQFIQNQSNTNIVQEEKRNIQDVASFANEKGGLSLLLDKQSLRTDESRAMSVAQKSKVGEGKDEAMAQLVKLSAADAGDASKAEHLAGAAASVLPAQSAMARPGNKVSETKVATGSSIENSAVSSAQTRSHQAVEGGTDITPPAFINVIGSMSQLKVSNAIITVSNNAQRMANESAAKASIRSVDSASRAGDKMIEAAQQNMNGAITSGVVGLVGQGATTNRSFKALNKESKSITTNLRPARNLELGVRDHQSSILSGKDAMVHQGKNLSADVEATMTKSHASDMHTSSLKRDAHNEIQLMVQKQRVGAEYMNQVIRSSQGVIDGSFGVVASEKQKEAELARADRDVNNELANVHSQVAKKTAEANAAAINALDNALATNNSTISSMAERS